MAIQLSYTSAEIQERLDAAGTAADLAKSAVTLVYSGAEVIPENSDLDDYMTPGNYRCINSSAAGTLSNCPVSVGFRMEVSSTTQAGRLRQNLYGNATNSIFTYTRYHNGTSWSPWRKMLSELDIDETLSVPGKAADAAAVGAAMDVFSGEAKAALLACFQHVAWIDGSGQDYYDALYEALYETRWPVTQSLTNCATTNAATAVLKGSAFSATITADTGYAMAGASVSITMGGTDITSTAYSSGTISIPAVTGALVITISAAAKQVSSISAVFTQSGTVYANDNLDSLKGDLVVTATYNDSSTAVVPAADYTLSGTLAEGTSTITVSYGGKTTTFDVTVTAYKMSYAYSDGDLIKVSAATSWTTENDLYLSTSGSTGLKRRSFVTGNGVKAFRETSDDSEFTEPDRYYPIPVPSTATQVVISITPSSMYVGPGFLEYDGNSYTRTLDLGWKQGGHTQSFAAGTYDYMTINSKFNASSSNFTSEPTEFTVTFS